MRGLITLMVLAGASPASAEYVSANLQHLLTGPQGSVVSDYRQAYGMTRPIAVDLTTLTADLAASVGLSGEAVSIGSSSPLLSGGVNAVDFALRQFFNTETGTRLYGLRPSQTVHATLTFDYSLATELAFVTDPVFDALWADSYRSSPPPFTANGSNGSASYGGGVFGGFTDFPSPVASMAQGMDFGIYALARADNFVQITPTSYSTAPSASGTVLQTISRSATPNDVTTLETFDPLSAHFYEDSFSFEMILRTDHRYDFYTRTSCAGFFSGAALYIAGNQGSCAVTRSPSFAFTNVRDLDGNPVNNLTFVEDPFNFGTGVPEPANWSLMIAGFGLVGCALRRRQANVAA